MKVVGSVRSDGKKDYRIKHDGFEYLCVRQGQKFKLHDRVGSMKELKEYVLSLDGLPDEDVVEAAEPVMNREWRTDPAALLAMLYEGMTVDRDAIMDTLDSWGYVTPAGEIDTESARKSFKALHKDKIYD